MILTLSSIGQRSR